MTTLADEALVLARGGAAVKLHDPLVARCQAGERAAFTELYRQHSAAIYRACYAMLADAREAEDALQQVFTVAFRKIHTFDGSSRASTWLHGIAIRTVANLRRRRQRRWRFLALWKQGADEVSHATPERHAAAREQLGKVDAALARLSEKQRVAFVLHHGEGLKLQEVADIMQASVQTTFARIKAARRELLRLIGGG